MHRRSLGVPILYLFISAIFVLEGCTKEKIAFKPYSVIQAPTEVPDVSNVDVSYRDPAIFANITSFLYGNQPTKVSSNISESLENLLDRAKVKSILLGTHTLTEIPFKDGFSAENANLSFSLSGAQNRGSVSTVKLSLLDWVNNDTMEHQMFVITMIPYSDCFTTGQRSGFSFIDSCNDFRGIIIFSEPDGTYISSHEYLGEISNDLFLVKPEEGEGDGINKVSLSFPMAPLPETKQQCIMVQPIEKIMLEASYCNSSRSAFGGGNTIYDLPISSRGSTINSILYYAGDIRNDQNGNLSHGGGGSVGSSSSRITNGYTHSGRIENLEVKANSANSFDKIKKLINSLDRLDIFDDLVNAICANVEIVVADTIKTEATTALRINKRDGKIVDLKSIIRIKEDATNGALFEELFHTYQGLNDPSWSKGDREFEAKVFNALLLVDDNNSDKLNFKDDNLTKLCKDMSEYYYNPNERTYKSVIEYLGKAGYYERDFPLSDMDFQERTKHIKQLLGK